MRRYRDSWRRGIARDVLIVTGRVVVSCGCVRGRRFDELVGHFASMLHEGLIHFLSEGWLHPTLAAPTGRGLGLAGCGAAMLLLASIPSFTSYLALSHLGVVQGRRPCQFDMVVGMSLRSLSPWPCAAIPRWDPWQTGSPPAVPCRGDRLGTGCPALLTSGPTEPVTS